MDVREKLVELLADLDCNAEYCKDCEFAKDIDGCVRRQKEIIADRLISHGVTVQECARPLEEWGEDYGDVLWWKFPIEEPPYVGSPLDEKWPAYHTHWTPIVIPQPPKGE